MSLPIATTTISVYRTTSEQQGGIEEPYSETTLTSNRVKIATGVRAHIGAPSGSESPTSGEQVNVTYRLDCDLTDINHLDNVEDEKTGELYVVLWVKTRTGLGLDHVVGALQQTEGVK